MLRAAMTVLVRGPTRRHRTHAHALARGCLRVCFAFARGALRFALRFARGAAGGGEDAAAAAMEARNDRLAAMDEPAAEPEPEREPARE